MDQSPASVGERIRWWRKRRQLSQRTLAELAGRSESWLQKVEAGDRIADRVPVLLAIANVLKISLGDLIGGVELPPNGGAPHDPPKGIHALRRALLIPPDLEPPTAADLNARIDGVGALVARGSFEARALVLPEVLSAGRAAAAHEVPRAWWGLARLYQMASGLLRRIGERDLALLAADRAVNAASRSDDAWLMATAQRRLALARMGEGWLDDSGAIASDAADAIAPTVATRVEGWSMWGSLRLTEAVVAARKADSAQAWRLLRDARVAAGHVGPGRNDYWECFGPANVGAHEVAVALELGDPVEALRVAGTIDFEELPSMSRQADVSIDVAHAHSLRRNDACAVGELAKADAYSPEIVRYSVKAREIVRVCLKRECKTLTPGLRDLAERLGVTV
ncbi:MAG: helix-turn-helix domain-containing protein [Egibacteraceae bacterium]